MDVGKLKTGEKITALQEEINKFWDSHTIK